MREASSAQAMKNQRDDVLLAAWSRTLAQRANEAAIFDTRREIVCSFAQIEERAHFFVNQSALSEFDPGEVIAIQIGNHADWPALLIACLRRQLVVLPIEIGIAEQEREAALRTCRVAGIVNCAEVDQQIGRINSADVIDWDERRPALLKLTSGTTAAPRAIRFRSAQLLADCEQICETMGITDADVNFGVIPVSHSYGFSNLITPLIARGVAMVLSRDRMPRAMLDNLARTKATVFPGMPLFFQAFGEMEAVPPLPKLRHCISAGAPLTLAVARKFREKFRKPIHSFYGASECGGICYDRKGRARVEGFVGAAMSGVQLEALEPGTQAGRVRVRSAAAGDDYFPEPDREKLGRGSFIPDDLIELSGEGARLVGRTSDVINVAGKKVNPAEVEAQLLRFVGVRQAVVFGRESSLRNEDVVACVVAAPPVHELDLLEFCRERLSGWQVPKRIYFVEQIPANERGKINRRELARQFAS
jgi:acyl-CoA synthetase (AMP-forming)/AMP-acid ligase II